MTDMKDDYVPIPVPTGGSDLNADWIKHGAAERRENDRKAQELLAKLPEEPK